MDILVSIIVVLGLTAAAVGLLAVVDRRISPRERAKHNEVAGFIYAIVGNVYAVLLALVVVAVWNQFEQAGDTVSEESSALAGVFWVSHGLPQPQGHQMQALASAYANEVVDTEWDNMAAGEPSPEGWAIVDRMRATLLEVEPTTPAETELYAEGLDQLQRLADGRRIRLVESEQGIPAVLTMVLVVGCVVTIGFTALFGLTSTLAHRIMVGSLAGLIGLVLVTVTLLDSPFSGGARVGPDEFERLLQRFETSPLSDLR
jgi:hypothetical protein